MLYGYRNIHGKHRTKDIKIVIKRPRTKRLRKKKGWFKCWDCNKWFNRYRLGAVGTLHNGERICGSCVVVRYKEKLI